MVIKSPASEEDNVTAMLQSMDQIFEAILDKECKITALERLLKVHPRPGPDGAGRTKRAGRTQRARRNGRGAMGGAQWAGRRCFDAHGSATKGSHGLY